VVATGLHKDYAWRMSENWNDLANGSVKLGANILEDVRRFEKMNPGQRIRRYTDHYKEYLDHLRKYEQTSGRTTGEVLRMEQELWWYRVIMIRDKMNGIAFGPLGELLK
jgi:hypothetical protein